MQTIVFRYVHLFCVAVLFENVNCDQFTPLNHKDDLRLYRITGCAAQCMQNNIAKTLSDCYKHCESVEETHSIAPLQPLTATAVNISLICRDETSLVVRLSTSLDSDEPSSTNITSSEMNKVQSRYHSEWLYIVKAYETNNLLAETQLYVSDSPIVRLKSLLPRTTYNISATVVNAKLQFAHVRGNSYIRTLELNYVPGKITNVSNEEFELNENKTGLTVMLHWLPAEDLTCHVDFMVYTISADAPYISLTKEIRRPELLNRFLLKDLSYGALYNLGFRTLNTRLPHRESNVSWIEMVTPTCLDFHNNNLTICPPKTPENVTMQLTLVTSNVYNMNLSWDQPTHNPDNYSISILDMQSRQDFNVSGEINHLYVADIQLIGQITGLVAANSPGGSSVGVVFETYTAVIIEVTKKFRFLRQVFIIGTLLLVLGVCCVFVFLFVRHQRAKHNRQRGWQQYFKGLDKNDPGDPEPKIEYKETRIARLHELQKFVDATACYKCMELNPGSILFGKVVGQGAFGLVRLASLDPLGTLVAVKTLRDCPTIEDMKSFYQEIEVMKSVPKHTNIVGIIGHYTKDVSSMMLVTEYCDRGNLLNFLQNIYQQLSRLSRALQPLPRNTTSSHVVINFDSLQNKYLNQDCNTSPEYIIVNQNSHFPGRQITLSQSSSTTPQSPEVNNLVVNKLYDISSKTDCNSTCKCDVEIQAGTDGCGVSIKIKDCYCTYNNNNNGNAPNKNQTTMVENPDYLETPNLAFQRSSLLAPTETVAEDGMSVGSSDLLDFAVQIANGMKFLSLNKVVHRDLAARNVLVCSDKTVKISDFGLSRDVYQDNVYQKTGGGKLPIKWMAIESLLRRTYTSQSDVWSFGILLYEIVTLGSSPYPSIAKNEDLLKHLQEEKRMDQPNTCSNELFQLMESCWAYEPSDRPTFSDVHAKLLALTDSGISHIRIGKNLNVHPADVARTTNIPTQSDNGSYMQPIQS